MDSWFESRGPYLTLLSKAEQRVVHSPRLEHRLELIDEEAVSEKAARDDNRGRCFEVSFRFGFSEIILGTQQAGQHASQTTSRPVSKTIRQKASQLASKPVS